MQKSLRRFSFFGDQLIQIQTRSHQLECYMGSLSSLIIPAKKHLGAFRFQFSVFNLEMLILEFHICIEFDGNEKMIRLVLDPI